MPTRQAAVAKPLHATWRRTRVLLATLLALSGLIALLAGCGRAQQDQVSFQGSGGSEGRVGDIVLSDAMLGYYGPIGASAVYRPGESVSVQVTIVNDGAAPDRSSIYHKLSRLAELSARVDGEFDEVVLRFQRAARFPSRASRRSMMARSACPTPPKACSSPEPKRCGSPSLPRCWARSDHCPPSYPRSWKCASWAPPKILMPLAWRLRVAETGGASPADVVVAWCGLSPDQRLTLELAPVGYSGLPPY